MQGSDRIVYGLGPLYAVRADGSTVTFARDGGKSVRAEVDGSGAVTQSFRFSAYGDLRAASPTGASPTALGYNGQLRDPSGLVYLRARWYDPATGRFLSRDPLRGDPASPATLNAFGYAGANPMLMSDPSGMAFSDGDEEGGPSRLSRRPKPARNLHAFPACRWSLQVLPLPRRLQPRVLPYERRSCM